MATIDANDKIESLINKARRLYDQISFSVGIYDSKVDNPSSETKISFSDDLPPLDYGSNLYEISPPPPPPPSQRKIITRPENFEVPPGEPLTGSILPFLMEDDFLEMERIQLLNDQASIFEYEPQAARRQKFLECRLFLAKCKLDSINPAVLFNDVYEAKKKEKEVKEINRLNVEKELEFNAQELRRKEELRRMAEELDRTRRDIEKQLEEEEKAIQAINALLAEAYGEEERQEQLSVVPSPQQRTDGAAKEEEQEPLDEGESSTDATALEAATIERDLHDYIATLEERLATFDSVRHDYTDLSAECRDILDKSRSLCDDSASEQATASLRSSPAAARAADYQADSSSSSLAYRGNEFKDSRDFDTSATGAQDLFLQRMSASGDDSDYPSPRDLTLSRNAAGEVSSSSLPAAATADSLVHPDVSSLRNSIPLVEDSAATVSGFFSRIAESLHHMVDSIDESHVLAADDAADALEPESLLGDLEGNDVDSVADAETQSVDVVGADFAAATATAMPCPQLEEPLREPLDSLDLADPAETGAAAVDTSAEQDEGVGAEELAAEDASDASVREGSLNDSSSLESNPQLSAPLDPGLHNDSSLVSTFTEEVEEEGAVSPADEAADMDIEDVGEKPVDLQGASDNALDSAADVSMGEPEAPMGTAVVEEVTPSEEAKDESVDSLETCKIKRIVREELQQFTSPPFNPVVGSADAATSPFPDASASVDALLEGLEGMTVEGEFQVDWIQRSLHDAAAAAATKPKPVEAELAQSAVKDEELLRKYFHIEVAPAPVKHHPSALHCTVDADVRVSIADLRATPAQPKLPVAKLPTRGDRVKELLERSTKSVLEIAKRDAAQGRGSAAGVQVKFDPDPHAPLSLRKGTSIHERMKMSGQLYRFHEEEAKRVSQIILGDVRKHTQGQK